MRRLYFLVPDLDITREIVQALESAGIEERYIHVVAAPGTTLEDLPEATAHDRNYLFAATKRGAEYGGTMGLLVGLLAMNLPGVVLAGGALLAMGMVGAGMGACLGCLLGNDVENVHIKQFADAIAAGQLLLLVDVPNERVSEFDSLIKTKYPDAKLGATEASPPDFPY